MDSCPDCGIEHDEDDAAFAVVVSSDGTVRIGIGPVHVEHLRGVLEVLASEEFVDRVRATVTQTVRRSKAAEN